MNTGQSIEEVSRVTDVLKGYFWKEDVGQNMVYSQIICKLMGLNLNFLIEESFQDLLTWCEIGQLYRLIDFWIAL